jgi:hypothetical protein
VSLTFGAAVNLVAVEVCKILETLDNVRQESGAVVEDNQREELHRRDLGIPFCLRQVRITRIFERI